MGEERQGETVGFALLDGRVAVHCADNGLVEWLREALLPGFDEVDPLPGDAQVIVDAILVRHDDEREPAAAEIPCFALDSGVRLLPARAIGSTVKVDDDYYGVRYEVGPESVVVRVAQTTNRLRPAVFRVVRELATIRARGSGRAELHAAGVERDGRVALMAGPKMAGKTTLLAFLASSTGAGVVTNDRALVSRTDGGWKVRGVPTVVNVRVDTATRLPHLFRDVPAVDHPVDLTLADAVRAFRSAGPVTTPGDVRLMPAQLAAALGAPLVGGGGLVRIAMPRFDASARGFRIATMTPTDALQRLPGVRYAASSEQRGPTLFEGFLGVGAPSADPALLAALAKEVRCVELVVGPSLLESSAQAGELLDALLESDS
jgi:hypothetical protein